MNSTPESGEVAEEVAPSSDDAAIDARVADPTLLEARDLALAALREITPDASIGEPADYRVEADGVVSLRFANRMAGYPGWFWTVSLARVEGAEPTVLEAELLPGDGALLAPDWVPWAERLADYQAAQVALAETALADEADMEDDLDDVDDLDAADFDEDGSSILHAGDVDGVDIDELDEDADSDAEADEDEYVSDDDEYVSDDEDDEDDDDSDEDDSDEDDEPDEGDESDEDDATDEDEFEPDDEPEDR